MKYRLLPLILPAALLVLLLPAQAQQYPRLTALSGHAVSVYVSPGHEQRAATLTHRIDKAMAYYQQLLDFTPQVSMLVLSPDDWSRHTTVPVVYGMPHYINDNTLVVAAQDNPFWQSFMPPPDQLPAELWEQLQAVYRNPQGQLSMEAFFDLLALHELGHAFHFQGGLGMQRKWMGEVFANTLLHTYIAEMEPEQLPALTLFPRMVVSGGTSGFAYTSLQDIDRHYDEIGRQHPRNYGWYQCRWHMAAATIYERGGRQVNRKWWDALKKRGDVLSDEQLLGMLEKEVDSSLAEMVRNWDRDLQK
jgi:hypothetical protein